jgi:hypothetical protein
MSDTEDQLTNLIDDGDFQALDAFQRPFTQ